MNHPDKQIMQRAIELAKHNHEIGGHAVAAIITMNGQIVAESVATIRHDKDSTAHAEMNAMRLAMKKLDNRYLENCYLYSTFEPCPMCASGAVWSKMKGIIYGANRFDANENAHQRIKISSEEILMHGEPKLNLYKDFMRKECLELLSLE